MIKDDQNYTENLSQHRWVNLSDVMKVQSKRDNFWPRDLKRSNTAHLRQIKNNSGAETSKYSEMYYTVKYFYNHARYLNKLIPWKKDNPEFKISNRPDRKNLLLNHMLLYGDKQLLTFFQSLNSHAPEKLPPRARSASHGSFGENPV